MDREAFKNYINLLKEIEENDRRDLLLSWRL
jgi:hypothetical protein